MGKIRIAISARAVKPSHHRVFASLGFFLLAVLITLPAHAESYSISSGTGFFISKNGHIVTNEHVVHGCDTVTIRGAVQPGEARVIAVDADVDLALLETSLTPPRIAPIRFYGNAIGAGDGVLVMGYPEERGITGEYSIVESEVMDVSGPLGQDKWLQFEDAARQGNSGGPLLDLSGNVVGVVVGKTVLTRTNLHNGQQELVQKSDVAISLPFLIRFLQDARVTYQPMYSGLQHSRAYIEQAAKDYIVNIHCRQ